MSLGDRARRMVLLKVAARSIREARVAWAAARVVPEEDLLRSAYLACVTASRATTIAATVWADHPRGRKLAGARKKIDRAAAVLLVQLSRVVAPA